MAREKKPSFQGLIEIASRLSWKAALALALISYMGFHYVATLPPLPDSVADQGAVQSTGPGVSQQLFGLLLEYIVPITFILGIAVSSFLARRRQAEQHIQALRDALQDMSGSEFQEVAAQAFGRLGYRVVQRGGEDQGAGECLVLYKGKDKFLVLCKHWKERRVEEAMVRELYAVMDEERAVGGFIVAAGNNLTDSARGFAEERCVKVVSAQLLLQMVNDTVSAAEHPKSRAAAPSCPECGGKMVRQTLKKGSMTGSKFWRCSRYPACRGIRA